MNPPVEAPTSRQSLPAGSTRGQLERVGELLAAAGDEARRPLDLERRPTRRAGCPACRSPGRGRRSRAPAPGCASPRARAPRAERRAASSSSWQASRMREERIVDRPGTQLRDRPRPTIRRAYRRGALRGGRVHAVLGRAVAERDRARPARGGRSTSAAGGCSKSAAGSRCRRSPPRSPAPTCSRRTGLPRLSRSRRGMRARTACGS